MYLQDSPGIIAALTRQDAGNVPRRAYHACSGCRREFFSADDFDAHECKAHKAEKPGEGGGSRPPDVISDGKVVFVNGVPMTEAQAASTPFKGARGATTSNANPRLDGEQILPDRSMAVGEGLESIDSRIAATRRVTEMKQTLADAGIECVTLNEAQTQEAYDRYIAGKTEGDGGKAAAKRRRKATAVND